MIKFLSELDEEDLIIVEDEDERTFTVEEILEDIESYKEKELFMAIGESCQINAFDVFDSAFESMYQDMYDGWYERIMEDITKEDVKDLQTVFDGILQRNILQNTVYRRGNKVIFDVGK